MFGATELMEGGRILADIGVSLVMSDFFDGGGHKSRGGT